MGYSTLYLYGEISKKFGKIHRFKVDSLTDCIAMLSTQFDKAEIKEWFSKYDFELVKDRKKFDKEKIRMKFEKEDNHFHLIPVTIGASKGIFNVIAGIALVAVSFFVPAAGVFGAGILTQSSIAMLGIGMALYGVGQMLAPSLISDYSNREKPDNRPSYVFNGPVNVTEQGATIPVGFGEFFCGSIVIASQLENEDD